MPEVSSSLHYSLIQRKTKNLMYMIWSRGTRSGETRLYTLVIGELIRLTIQRSHHSTPSPVPIQLFITSSWRKPETKLYPPFSYSHPTSTYCSRTSSTFSPCRWTYGSTLDWTVGETSSVATILSSSLNTTTSRDSWNVTYTWYTCDRHVIQHNNHPPPLPSHSRRGRWEPGGRTGCTACQWASSVVLSNQRVGSCHPPEEERQGGEVIQKTEQQVGNKVRYV